MLESSMKEFEVTSLELDWGSLLDDVDSIGRELPYVFFANCPTAETESCLVLTEDEFEPNEDVPEAARRRGFAKSLLVGDIQQVLENLRQQDAAAERQLQLQAITFYFERDAFIDLST
jgi:hypothetical protein